jgi:hypothetical protein
MVIFMLAATVVHDDHDTLPRVALVNQLCACKLCIRIDATLGLSFSAIDSWYVGITIQRVWCDRQIHNAT